MSFKKKIVIINDSFLKDSSTQITGGQVQTYLLAKGLAERGHKIHYVAGTKDGEKAGNKVEYENLSVQYFKSRRFIFANWLQVPKILSLLKSIDADVYYNRGRSLLTGVTARAAYKNGSRFIWASNGKDGCERWKYLKRLKGKDKSLWRKAIVTPFAFINDLIYSYGIKRANIIINQDKEQKKDLFEYFGKEGHILKSGCPKPPKTFPKKVPPIVLWIGRLDSHKQPGIFVELAQKLQSLHCEFQLAGDTNNQKYKQELFHEIERLPNLHYIGFVPFEKSTQIIGQAKILVNTSKWEGLSNTFIQAWSQGTVVVSLNSDPDDVLKNKNIGFHSKSFEKLVEDTKILIEDEELWREMSEKSRKVAREEYSLEKIVENLEKLIKQS